MIEFTEEYRLPEWMQKHPVVTRVLATLLFLVYPVAFIIMFMVVEGWEIMIKEWKGVARAAFGKWVEQ